MKNTLLLIFSILFIASCNNQPNPEKETTEEPKEIFKSIEAGDVCYTIGDQYAGEFIIGNDIPKQEELENFIINKGEVTLQVEGEEIVEMIYTISDGDKDLLNLIPQIQRINGQTFELIKEIEVFSDKFKTSFGITVGSALEDFVSAYPDYKIWYSYVGDIVVIESEEIQAQFLLSKKDFVGKIDNTNDIIPLKLEDFKAGAKIQKIRLF